MGTRVAKADQMTKGKIVFVKTHSRSGIQKEEIVDREEDTAKKVDKKGSLINTIWELQYIGNKYDEEQNIGKVERDVYRNYQTIDMEDIKGETIKAETGVTLSLWAFENGSHYRRLDIYCVKRKGKKIS
ncbi:hypothetical protein TWF225_008447 [Orbilia oligospora]|uniref:Uncharacterized protein n=1 Tax=Orbilia oligospora TaxID=2813651 RepID=A0A7C8JZ46_ORBOL|nr:hypothetical protein TWF751_003528 [Orbilia oligospora]KAF3177465.1 hypothetical protein TWF225_008447 [Orbilia oligospora]KAF3235150.1 hypothetical protein TWF217_003195 [Orbilia oligospora]KAF3237229.1 hypothetical protein TWF128_000992 [Orbilia oligospora]KAF3295996.1 hypothetical protein TWF132_000538 [Orbilia oligospora]